MDEFLGWHFKRLLFLFAIIAIIVTPSFMESMEVLSPTWQVVVLMLSSMGYGYCAKGALDAEQRKT